MSYGTAIERTIQTGGIASLTAMKAADVALSIAVLLTVPAAEKNPIARAAWDAGQVGGLLAVAIAMVAVIVLATEGGVFAVRRYGGDRRARITTRLVGYGLPCLWWGAIAAHNALEVSEVIGA